MSDTAQIPPYSAEAETGLLGSVLQNADALFAPDSTLDLPRLPVAAFYTPAHMLVWESVLRLRSHAAPINLLTVLDDLRAANELDRAGGAAGIERLVDATPTPTHAAYYLAQVRAAYQSRRLIDAAREIERAALAGEDPAPHISALAAVTAPPTPGIALSDAYAYLKDAPPPHDPIFLDLIDRGDKGGIIAKAKTRKTFFAMQMALCAAAGQDFLRWRPARQLAVLYCNYEIRPHHAWRRLHWIGKHLGIHPGDIANRLQVANLRGADIDVDGVCRLVEGMRADLVILDPLYKVVKGGDENKAEDLKPYLAQFDALCERTGACLWYVHHDTKGHAGDRDARDRGSGSSVLNRDFDACITLTDHVEGNDHLVMHALPRNYAPGPDLTIKWEDGAFQVSDMAPEAMTSQKQQSPHKDKIKAYAAEHPEASVRDIAKAVKCSTSTVAKWWDNKEEDGL